VTSLRAGRAGNSKDAPPYIEGYASVFNKLSVDLGGFREKIKPSAFARAIKEKQDVRCLFNHNSDIGVLGRTSAGTLTMREDAHGLFYRCDLPETQLARDLHASIKRGDVQECSFSFTIPTGGQTWTEGRFSKDPNDENYDPDFDPDEDEETFASRTLTDVDLLDCSPVVWAAYPQTNISARADKRSRSSKRFHAEATMQDFSPEQRAYLRTECEGRFAVVPVNCPEPFLSQILEKRAAVLGISPAGPTPAPNSDLADELNALRAL